MLHVGLPKPVRRSGYFVGVARFERPGGRDACRRFQRMSIKTSFPRFTVTNYGARGHMPARGRHCGVAGAWGPSRTRTACLATGTRATTTPGRALCAAPSYFGGDREIGSPKRYGGLSAAQSIVSLASTHRRSLQGSLLLCYFQPKP